MATLKVTVHEARDVPIMDSTTGLADLYVVVKLDDLEYTTDIVHMSRYPVWNKVFRLDTPDLLVLQEDPLEVRLYDHDIISRDDIVGHTFVDCNSMVLQSNPSMSGWFPLYDTSSAGIRGEVRLTVKIKFHTAENPLAPRLPKRYVRRPPPTIDAADLPRRDARLDEAGTMSSPNLLPILQGVTALEPLQVTRVQHPSLMAEEEGIFIFSAPRLDPSVYRVESVLTMVEELIVKADPEHSKLTNLRSTRTTNEARIVQLFKLSGKVRRQLARKVVEMHCNAVLGYEEEFDMEPGCIIVRAYGTPCVISAVKMVDHAKVAPLLLAGSQLFAVGSGTGAVGGGGLVGGMPGIDATSSCASPALASCGTPPFSIAAPDRVSGADTPVMACDGSFSRKDQPNTVTVASTQTSVAPPYVVILPEKNGVQTSHFSETMDGPTMRSPSSHGLTLTAQQQQQPSLPQPSPALPPPAYASYLHEVPAPSPATPNIILSEGQEERPAQGSRTNVLILTVKDLPSGMVEHIGGHICARSVKIVAKMKSKQMISQERDAWWMELREELKANARAFHCNVILGYEEDVLHYEDVAVLSLSGTAVMLNPVMLPLRCGPEFLFQRARDRFRAKRNCSVLHLYRPTMRHKDLSEEIGDLISHNICNVCHGKPVPDVLLMSCVIPQDVSCEGLPRLVQVVTARAKNAVRGVPLALAVSQALPFIEYSLHKQLFFNLRLQQLNAVFGLRVTIAITEGSIIGTLTGTACRLIGLPIPSPPQVEVVDPTIRRSETVMRLKDIVEQHKRASLRSHRNRYANASNLNGTLGGQRELSHSSASSTTESVETDDTSPTWATSASDSDSGPGRADARVSDYVVKIDDEEEAEMLLGVVGDLTFEDSLLLTVPYVPEYANTHYAQDFVALHRRFALQHGGAIATSAINDCLVDAKRAFVQTVCRAALRRHHTPPERLAVLGFKVDFIFEPNSEALQLRLEGCLMTSTAAQLSHLTALEDRAFKECLRYLENDPKSIPLGPFAADKVSTTHHTSGEMACSLDETLMPRTTDGSHTSAYGSGVRLGDRLTYHIERNIFVMSNAPYALPYVFQRDVPPPTFWPKDETDPTTSAPLDVQDFYRTSRSRPGMVGRQWQALTSLASTAFRNLMEKTRANTDSKAGGDGSRRDTLRDSQSLNAALHQPVMRLPPNFNEMEANEVGVIFTPLAFVAGQAIVRYVGRLSQHFIREAYDINTENDLCQFFQNTDFEIQCVVQSMVQLMGGNALLKHRAKYHEVWDSDGSGSAFVFLTVTGDVVQTTSIPLVPLSPGAEKQDEDDDMEITGSLNTP